VRTCARGVECLAHLQFCLTMTLEFTGTLQDFIDGQRTHAWRKYSPAVALFQKILEPIVGLALLIYGIHLIRIGANGAFWLVEIACGLYVLLATRVIAPLLYRRAYRRRRGGPSHSTTYDFNDGAIECISPGRSEAKLDWKIVRGFVDGPKSLLIYTAPGLFLAIPKRVLDESRHEELLSLLDQHQIPATYPK